MSQTPKSTSGTPPNPYAQAAGTYSSNAQQTTGDQRELEGMILMKSARMLQELHDSWSDEEKTPENLQEVLKYNRQIWLVFYDAALENPDGDRPNELRSNIINLANFIFKREIAIVTTPAKEKLKVLININKEVAAGLMTKQDAKSAQQE